MQGVFFLRKKTLSFCAPLYTHWRIALDARPQNLAGIAFCRSMSCSFPPPKFPLCRDLPTYPRGVRGGEGGYLPLTGCTGCGKRVCLEVKQTKASRKG